MNYCKINKTDTANGTGVRVTLFVSGCTHHCDGCFQKETWDFKYGKPFTKETEDEIIEALNKNYIEGLTLLGGEPFEKSNQLVLTPFLRRVKNECKGKNVWAYSGYLFDEELKKDSRARCEVTDEMLSMIDILVDGEFKKDLKNLRLSFRGSENQRIIDVKKSLEQNKVILDPLNYSHLQPLTI